MRVPGPRLLLRLLLRCWLHLQSAVSKNSTLEVKWSFFTIFAFITTLLLKMLVCHLKELDSTFSLKKMTSKNATDGTFWEIFNQKHCVLK